MGIENSRPNFETQNPPEVSKNDEVYTDVVLAGLEKFGVLSRESGRNVFDVGKMQNWSSKGETIYGKGPRSRRLNYLDIAKALSQIRGIAKASEVSEENTNPERPVMVMPKSLEDLLSHAEGGYAQRNKMALLEPWRFGKKHKSWTSSIKLDSGEETNMSEMAVVDCLNKMNAEREGGRLMVTHPESGERVVFSAAFLPKFFGIKPSITEGKEISRFDEQPLQFAGKYLPNLMKAGVFEKTDFRLVAGSRTAEQYNAHERRFSNSKPYVHFTNVEGQSGNYYMGRGNIVGTKIPFDSEKMRAIKLDPTTVAVVLKTDKGAKILTTFDLLSKDEMDPLQGSVRKRLEQRGEALTKKNIAINTTIGVEQMQKRMREYSVTDYLHPRANEDRKEYYRRVRPLDDPDFVFKKVQGFFEQAGVGTHNLPWAEQLVLSLAVQDKKDEQELLEFAKEYGLPGIRVFLALGYDKSLGQTILKIGKQLDKEAAQQIFEKYSDIAVQAKEVEGFLKKEFPNTSVPEHLLQGISDDLFSKANELLKRTVSDPRPRDKEKNILAELEAYRTEAALYSSTVKEMAKEGQISLQEIIGQNILVKDSGELNEEEKKQMLAIFKAGRSKAYPEGLRTASEIKFEKKINEPGHTFYMLMHENQPIVFFHADRISPDTLYVGGLNLSPDAKGPLATSFANAWLEEHGKRNNIKADVLAENRVAQMLYRRTLGFKVDPEKPNFEVKGSDGKMYEYINLIRPKKNVVEISNFREMPKAA